MAAALSDSCEHDMALFQKIKKDDPFAFKTLFLRYYDKLSRFLFILHRNESLAEEVIQDVFTKIWEKRHAIDINTSVSYYLYTSCKNLALNVCTQKANRHRDLSEAADSVAEELNPEEIFAYHTLHQDLDAAINSLPPKAREVFTLKYFHQTKHKDIARRMAISESMVEKHVANALHHLRQKLAVYSLK